MNDPEPPSAAIARRIVVQGNQETQAAWPSPVHPGKKPIQDPRAAECFRSDP